MVGNTVKQKKLELENIEGWRSKSRPSVTKFSKKEPDTEIETFIGGWWHTGLNMYKDKLCCCKAFIYRLVTTGNLPAGVYFLHCNSNNGGAATEVRI